MICILKCAFICYRNLSRNVTDDYQDIPISLKNIICFKKNTALTVNTKHSLKLN